jgi:hypothetical protein
LFQIGSNGSTLYGYSIEDFGARSGHFWQAWAWDLLDSQELQVKMARMACHFLVDLTPSPGLEEVLEKTAEIREYYCSLESPSLPVFAEEVSVAVNSEVLTHVRDSFTYSEE